MEYNKEDIKNLKIALERFYIKVRKSPYSRKVQDSTLKKFIEEDILERVISGGKELGVSEEESKKDFENIKEMINTWQKEIDSKKRW